MWDVQGIGLDCDGCRRLVGFCQFAGFSGVVMTVHSSGISPVSLVAGGSARVMPCQTIDALDF